MAERIRGLAGHYSRLPAQRRLEVGRALLLAGRQEHRVDAWIQEYCAILFFKGSLLKDEQGILITQTENVQAARQIRFSSVEEIHALEAVLKSYIREATEVERAGLQVPFKKTDEFAMPEELQRKLDGDPGLKKAFASLTPGRQRAYLLFFSAPKQAKTRESRIEKSEQKILAGKGLHDE